MDKNTFILKLLEIQADTQKCQNQFILDFFSLTPTMPEVVEPIPVVEVVEPAPVVEVVEPIPVVEVVEPAPVVEVVEPIPVVEVVEPAPVVEVVEPIPVVEVAVVEVVEPIPVVEVAVVEVVEPDPVVEAIPVVEPAPVVEAIPVVKKKKKRQGNDRIDLSYYRKISSHYKKNTGGKGVHKEIGDAVGLLALAIIEGDKYDSELEDRYAKEGSVNYELSKLAREYEPDVIKESYLFLAEKYPEIINNYESNYPDIAKSLLGINDPNLLPIEPVIISKYLDFKLDAELEELVINANKEKQLFLRKVAPREHAWHTDVLDIPNDNYWGEGSFSILSSSSHCVGLSNNFIPNAFLAHYLKTINSKHQYMTPQYLWGRELPDVEWRWREDDTVWTRLSDTMVQRGERLDIYKEYGTEEEIKEFVSYHYREAAKQLFKEEGNLIFKKSSFISPFWHLPTNLGRILNSEAHRAKNEIMDDVTFKTWRNKVRVEKVYIDHGVMDWALPLKHKDYSLTVPSLNSNRYQIDLDFFAKNYTLSEFHYLFPELLWGYGQMFGKIDFLSGGIKNLDPLPIDKDIAAGIISQFDKMTNFHVNRALANKSAFLTALLARLFSTFTYYGFQANRCSNLDNFNYSAPYFETYAERLSKPHDVLIDYSDIIDFSFVD